LNIPGDVPVLTVIFAPSDVHALEVTGVQDALVESNWQPEHKGAAYDILVVSEEPGPIRCASGLHILPDCTIADVRGEIDTLIITGTYGLPRQPSHQLVTWIAETAAGARRYGSVCTGVFLLAAAGLIDGKRVTTHWEYAPDLASACPKALVEPDRIFVRDGPLFTSAGTTAAIDLTLALIEEDHGRDLALAVARRLVVFLKRPGGQSQFSVQLATQTALRSPIERVQVWINENLSKDLSIADLAREAGMSQRNFARVFKAQTGTTPAEYVEIMRVDAARRMLEDTNLDVRRLAVACGFKRSASLRRAFLNRLGVTPTGYRDTFSSTSGQ
jgi:transcriptional regulator GlxA family with amidase domain